jgi:hypothetical protein
MRINGIRYHTWEDWKHQGYVVRFGERSYYRNRYGTPVFARTQVTTKLVSYPRYRLVREYY